MLYLIIVFENFGGGNFPVALLLVVGSASNTWQRHFETTAAAANVWDLVQ